MTSEPIQGFFFQEDNLSFTLKPSFRKSDQKWLIDSLLDSGGPIFRTKSTRTVPCGPRIISKKRHLAPLTLGRLGSTTNVIDELRSPELILRYLPVERFRNGVEEQ